MSAGIALAESDGGFAARTWAEARSALDGGYSLLLCDYYDSVVHRRVPPQHTKKIASTSFATAACPSVASDEFFAARVRVEAELCEASRSRGFDLEFRIADLAVELFRHFRSHTRLSEPAWTQSLIANELEAEKRVQFVNQGCVELLVAAKERGLPVWLVSDNYLSARMLRKLLEYHEIDRLFHDVLVSSDFLLSKRAGRLYDIVHERIAKRDRVLMIGDSLEADYRNATARGFDALWIPAPMQQQAYSSYKAPTPRQCLEECETNVLRDGETRFHRLGESLAVYCDRLYRRARSLGHDVILFASREGVLLKRAFDVYQEVMVPARELRLATRYLMVSRRSSFLPSLGPLEAETFETLFRQYQRISVFDFVDSLGLREQLEPELIERFGCRAGVRQEWFSTSDVFRDLMGMPAFRAVFERTRVEQEALLRQYVNELCGSETSAVMLADVGWKGTIQDNLQRLLGEQRRINGAYLGLIADYAPYGVDRKLGLLFDYRRTAEPAWSVFNENRALFEVLLTADHGSVTRYAAGDAGVVARSEQLRAEEVHAFERCSVLQAGVISHLREVLLECLDAGFDVDELWERVVMRHASLLLQPTEKELDLFGELEHYENFGMFGASSFSQSASLRDIVTGFFGVLLHPKEPFPEQPAWWPALRLRQLGLNFGVRLHAKAKVHDWLRTYCA